VPAGVEGREQTDLIGRALDALASNPAINAIVVLNHASTGLPTAVIDGGPITARRTAAVSGVAIREWAQEQPAHKAVALAQVAAAMLPAQPARAAVLADEADRLAATVCGRWGAGSILTALTYQRMADAFAVSDPARALRYAHVVDTTPETALVKVDTLVDIATAVPAPQLRRTPRVPRQRQA